MAVMNRIKKMQGEKLILGYRCSLNLEKLGYTHLKLFLFTEGLSHKRKKTLLEFIKQWQHSVYITETVSEADLEFEVHVPNLHILNDFMRKLRNEFPEVKNYDSCIFYREEIIRYFPYDG